jgi:hypothetical protein
VNSYKELKKPELSKKITEVRAKSFFLIRKDLENEPDSVILNEVKATIRTMKNPILVVIEAE